MSRKEGEIMKINYKGFVREKIQRNPVTISPDTTLFQAWGYIHMKSVRHLPVADKEDRLLGIGPTHA
jgi:CBS domain-containing protein